MAPSRYCDREDLYSVGAQRDAFGDMPETQIAKAILDASALMDSYFRQRYSMPFSTVNDRSLVMHCAAIATFFLMSGGVGYNPDSTDRVFRERYDDAIAWLKDVQANRCSPAVVDSSAPPPAPGYSNADTPQVISSSGRGLSTRQTDSGLGWFQED